MGTPSIREATPDDIGAAATANRRPPAAVPSNRMTPRRSDAGWSSVIRVLAVVAALIVGPILIAFLLTQG